MAGQRRLSSFSANGEHLAYSSADGLVNLWETSTGNLIQEISPSKHLTATCTCLQWGPGRHLQSLQTPRKKKKRKSDVETAVSSLNLIAIGTSSGTILLYSFAKGQIHTHLEGGHTDEVTDICWHPAGAIMYSSSVDGHVVEWDITAAQVRERWKANSGGVHAICLCSSSRLLTASRVIKMWDLSSRTLLQKFTGHSTEVFRLLPVLNSAGSRTDEEVDPLACSYFLSAAVNDRVISAWYCNTDLKEKNSITSFSLSDEPISVNVMTSKEQITLAVLTTKGQVLVFEHTLNGKLKKPLKPKTVVHATTSGSKEEVAMPVSILAALPKDVDGPCLLVAHGSFLKPKFESVALRPSQPEVVLIVASPTKAISKPEFSQVKVPDVSSNSTVIFPSQMAPRGPSKELTTRKRKQSVSELTLEERLNAISVDQPVKSSVATRPPKADTLVNLLTQGLQSKDAKILTNVLQERSEDVIANTVKRLPVQVVVPLVQELSHRMHGHAQSGQTVVRWLKPILSTHTSYLMTFPEIVDTLGELYQMIDWRMQPFLRLTSVQGRLDLLLSQVTSQNQEEEEPASSSQPLLVYQDESSDDDIPMEFGASESEDNWEDLSDMD